MSENYHGLIISPRPYELKDGTGRKVAAYIAQDVDGETVDTAFTINKVFETKAAAMSASFEFERRKSDELVRSSEIEGVRNQSVRLPSTHAHGLGHKTDDVAVGGDGQPTKTPELRRRGLRV